MVGGWNEGHPLSWYLGESPDRLEHLTTVLEEQSYSNYSSPLASVSHSRNMSHCPHGHHAAGEWGMVES